MCWCGCSTARCPARGGRRCRLGRLHGEEVIENSLLGVASERSRVGCRSGILFGFLGLTGCKRFLLGLLLSLLSLSRLLLLLL